MTCMIYLNLHWQLSLDSAAVGEIRTFARPLHKYNGIHNEITECTPRINITKVKKQRN